MPPPSSVINYINQTDNLFISAAAERQNKQSERLQDLRHRNSGDIFCLKAARLLAQKPHIALG